MKLEVLLYHVDHPLVWVPVATLQEASIVTRQCIEKHSLGSRHWYGGAVRERGGQGPGKAVANISYNGRIWDTHGKEIK